LGFSIYKNSSTSPFVNYQLSLSYLKKAAQYEHPEAIYSLGRIHELGLLDQPQDQWKAYQYYAEASDLQYPVAMLNLAKQYQAGIPGHLSSQNDLAFKWCKRAADLGYDQAEYTLGWVHIYNFKRQSFLICHCPFRKYYEQGIGVTKDVQFAFEYFGKAASSNHRLASEKLNRHLGHLEKQTQHIKNVTEKKKKK
jgi:TPR repeat protein